MTLVAATIASSSCTGAVLVAQGPVNTWYVTSCWSVSTIRRISWLENCDQICTKFACCLADSNAMAFRKLGRAWSKYSGLCNMVFSMIITNWFKKFGSLLGDLNRISTSRVGDKATREFINEFSTEESPVLNRAAYIRRTASMSTLVPEFCLLAESNRKLLFSDSELENTMPMLCTSFL